MGRRPAHGHDWFSLGGILLREHSEQVVREHHRKLQVKWELTAPLHSAEIRGKSRGYAWLGQVSAEKRQEFLEDVEELATRAELTALACVIDRPGYNARYRDRYGPQRWLLCKTAFHVVVERAAKFALAQGCQLRVYVEKSDKVTDDRLRAYYDAMRTSGHLFDAEEAARYHPLGHEALSAALYEFRTKAKSSPPMQVADVCLWPMCMGGYDAGNRAYSAMRDRGVLIDCKLPAGAVAERGIKYSCMAAPGDP